MASQSEPSAPPDQTFQSYLAAGEMRIQRCESCARSVFFPRTICPHCGSADLDWQPITGSGSVYSSTIVRQRVDRGGDYNVSLVDLEEGVRLMSRVEGVPPDQVAIGMAVIAGIAERDGVKAIVFRPAQP